MINFRFAQVVSTQDKFFYFAFRDDPSNFLFALTFTYLAI